VPRFSFLHLGKGGFVPDYISTVSDVGNLGHEAGPPTAVRATPSQWCVGLQFLITFSTFAYYLSDIHEIAWRGMLDGRGPAR
jgi:hypothetical protein